VTRYGPAQLARLLGLPEPTHEQAAVTGAPLEPMAVIAGAGSGKSETMAARLVWLAANGVVRPDQVLGLTFTRKAAAELGQRVRARLAGLRRAGLGSGAEGLDGEPVVSTYHAYAARLVADNALREALEPSMRLITPAVAWQIAARVTAAHDGPMDAVPWAPPQVTAAVLALAGELAEHLRTPAEVRQAGQWLTAAWQALPGPVPGLVKRIVECQRTREQLLAIVTAYTEAKAAKEVMDYGDQVALAARIATRHPEVGAAERGKYRVVLLDEFQDTSYAQLVLLRALFGGGHPVTAVGDPCQSIYGWRGASAGNLRRFAAEFPRPLPNGGPPRPATVTKLATSFRNTERVLEVAAAIQQGLRDQAPFVPRLVPPPSRTGRGTVVCALLGSAASEARWVAGRISELLSLPPAIAPDGEPWPGHGTAQVQPSDIAVLCRKRAQFPALRSAIEARGIPVEVVGLGGLLTVPEVADVVATLRVLHDPGASSSLARLLTGPRWRIGPRDLVALGRRARGLASEQRAPAREQPSVVPGEDPLSEAVTDITAEPGSLVEALDDLGEPAVYSPEGYARFSALATELRTLRGHVARPLPDLVGEVERVLGLDVEVAAQPWRDPATARADLDAFVDAAAAFADDDEEPTLGAFLAYLTAAEAEEYGLESGQPSGANAVTLTTVHAAKGLQWGAVVVPGLSAGRRAQVFPAKPRVTTRWTENPRLLPFGLRGDAGDLPVLADLGKESLEAFTGACADRELAEERRLAYVAVTRAAFWVACTGYWWGECASRLGPSVFLREVRAACEAGAGVVAHWEPEPPEDAQNPALAQPAAAQWPMVPHGPRYEAVKEAAALVESALTEPGARPARPPAQDAALAQAWARDTGLLLAELARRRGEGGTTVRLPDRLPVSSLITMAASPDELAAQIRRPMPRPPSPGARRGTAFHRWLEERFGQQRLIDPADLLGAADDPADDPDAADLAALKERFEAGEWSDRWPVEVEVPFETLIAGRAVRGRIDAVFSDPRTSGYDVIDWKTGQPPATSDELRTVAIQLAAYRLAWARLAGVPLAEVRAGFYYVRHDLTLRPTDLLDEAGLAALIEGVPAAG
jgi:DNA helicase-2/ATP-dependent DNA helicase PcrA